MTREKFFSNHINDIRGHMYYLPGIKHIFRRKELVVLTAKFKLPT